MKSPAAHSYGIFGLRRAQVRAIRFPLYGVFTLIISALPIHPGTLELNGLGKPFGWRRYQQDEHLPTPAGAGQVIMYLDLLAGCS